jgi:hypothetical protein
VTAWRKRADPEFFLRIVTSRQAKIINSVRLVGTSTPATRPDAAGRGKQRLEPFDFVR